MPKLKEANKCQTLELIESLSLKASTTRAGLDAQTLRRIAHDLRAASGAFEMLVEELETQVNEATSTRQITKTRQLRAHALNNTRIIEILCDALTTD